MTKSDFLKLIAAAGLALGSPAFAQITAIDPNDAGEYEPAASAPATQPQPQDGGEYYPAEPAPEEYQPVDAGSQNATAPVQQAAPVPVQGDAETRASAAVSDTVAKDSVLSAAEGVFGRGAEGLAGLLEDILKKQGQPTAYITGSEAGGAMVVGLRYGKGVLHHQTEGDRKIYWTGPSVGFDIGGDASKVFVLVYNVDQSDKIFTRFGAAEGKAYVVGGFAASYLRRGDMVLIPIRTGVGVRVGVNAGYMRFSEKNRWLPF
jgi:hypothetical protein